MTKIVYLAHPYSNAPDENYLSVCDILGRLLLTDYKCVFISPISNFHTASVIHPQLGSDWNMWKEQCLGLLSVCDEIWVAQVDGWDTSVGVRAEIDWAIKNGVRVVLMPQ